MAKCYLEIILLSLLKLLLLLLDDPAAPAADNLNIPDLDRITPAWSYDAPMIPNPYQLRHNPDKYMVWWR